MPKGVPNKWARGGRGLLLIVGETEGRVGYQARTLPPVGKYDQYLMLVKGNIEEESPHTHLWKQQDRKVCIVWENNGEREVSST